MSPRAFTRLEGSRVGGRFQLEGDPEPGFTSVGYAATDDRGERCRVLLVDPALSVATPNADQVREVMETLGRINHGGLLRPYAAGIDAALGCAYFVEPTAPGISLPGYLKEHGRLDSRTATALLGQLAGALVELHAIGSAHRAITAETIVVKRENGRLTARLTSFADGVSQPNEAAIELDTQALLAPEIAEGARGDARADVWALAAVLHQTVDASTHDNLAGLLARCLHDDPKERPADAGAFLAALPASGTGGRTDDGGLSLDATVEADPKAGRFIGDYEILSLLGEGGMGAVYEVRDESGQTFALKVIRGEGKAPRERRRFLREVKAAAELASEHITRVVTSGVDTRTGAPFMVMELLHGADVATVIKREGALDPAVAARIAADACQGLAVAHARGLVHRDIKPPNLFLHQVEDRVVTKVCDFGIVKDTGLGQANTVLTRTGALIGSPSYMSPEQAKDSSIVDLRTDVWSLSATLYEMLAGVPPWDGAKNIGEILVLLQTRDVPPLREVAPWVPEALASVVHRGLSRAVDERYPSASALRAALEPFCAAAPLATAAVKGLPAVERGRSHAGVSGATSTVLQPTGTARARHRRGWVAAIVGAATIALGLSAWQAWQTPTAEEPPNASPPTAASCELAACRLANGGKASRCGADGACIALENDQCRALADERALSDPDTLWIGTMFPSRNKDAFFADFGRASEEAIELARRDFASVGGLPRTGKRPRGIGVLACEDSSDAAAAAKHLVAAGVPAVIGFRSSNDVIELAQSQFIPNDVLVVPSLNASALITSIPHPPDKPRMVFRTAVTNDTAVAAVAALLDGAVGPLAGLDRSRMKLLLVRDQTTVGMGVSEAVFERVRVAELGARFRELSLDDTRPGTDPTSVVASALEHLPDVVILHLSDSMVRHVLLPLEKRWPLTTKHPTYIVIGSVDGALADAIRTGEFRSNLLSMGTAIRTTANLKFTNSYNAAFNQKLPPEDAPAAPYDSFYLIAYAAYASGMSEPRGSDLARAIARLVPPGKPIEVGPAGILEVFAELDRGGSIDLQGALSRMDFDRKTGESPADYAIFCPRRAADQKSLAILDSGMVFDSGLKKLTGTFNCK